MSIGLHVCSATLALGLRRAVAQRALTGSVALPCFWALYNAVPQVLFFVHVLGSRRSASLAAFWLQPASMLAGVGAVVALWFV